MTKKTLFYLVVVVVVLISCGVNEDTLGEVSFKTSRTWKVGRQTWSDVVVASGCKKIVYYGGTGTKGEKGYMTDCRSTPNRDGDLFSWPAVVLFQDQLCPDGWRVPTKNDFEALNIALGGTGKFVVEDSTLRDKLLNLWGGSYGKFCGSYGRLRTNWIPYGMYWSQSESGVISGYCFTFSLQGDINPQDEYYKHVGLRLRCVR